MFVKSYLQYVLLTMLFLCGYQTVNAQNNSAETNPAAQPQTLTITAVQQQTKQLESNADLDAEIKKKCLKLLQDALKLLQQTEQFLQQSSVLLNRRESTSQLQKEIDAALAKELPQVQIPTLTDATVDVLEKRFAEAKEYLNTREKKLSEHKTAASRRATRRAEIPNRQKTLNEQIPAIEKALSAPPQANDPRELTAAQQTYQIARLRAARAELKLMADELVTYEATNDLNDLEQQLATRDVQHAKEIFRAWELELNKQRVFKAREQFRDAEILVKNASGVLKPIAKENFRFAMMRVGQPDDPSTGMIAKIEQAQTEFDQVKKSLREVDEIALEFDEKEEFITGASFFGPWLMEQRIKLPHSGTLRRQIRKRQQGINEIRLKISEIRKIRNSLQNREQGNAKTTLVLDPRLRAEQRKNIYEAAEEIYTIQLEIVRDLLEDYTTYINRLTEISISQQELITRTEQLSKKFDAQLIWSRTTGTLNINDSAATINALIWLTEPSHWIMLLVDLQEAIRDQFEVIITVLFGLLFLLVFRQTAKRKIRILGREASSSYLTPFHYTISAIVLTILISLLWPLLVYLVGWLLNSSMVSQSFSRAVGAALMGCSAVLLMLELMRKILSSEGLAGSHFRWSMTKIRDIRKSLRFITIFGLPLLFVMVFIHIDGDLDRINSLGRVLLIVLQLLLAFFLHRILTPAESKLEEVASRSLTTQSRIVYWLSMAVPFVIILLTAAGYHFTAWEMFKRLLFTLALMVGISLIYGAMLRWLRLLRGTMTLEQVQARKVAEEEKSNDEMRDLVEMESANAPQIDLESINQQTRKLLQASVIIIAVIGLWVIWNDVIPGAAYFDHVLWRASEIQVVTVHNVLLAVFIAIIAIASARNIPGLIEVLLPHDINMDAGSRYAFSTLVRYFIVGIALVFISSLIGFGWSKVQWLVAALSVGVGFGLQELVANFISGLILLFERPIRVGDVITVDDVTGVVTRVQMRATTIRNWDRQEYIVPNKDLVTGRLLNWTLSSQVNRIVINVGVAYGSDVQQVREVLLSIVSGHEKILQDPEPLVTFEQFADSSLNFVVRACIDRLNDRLEMTHELHTLINDRFNEEGIEIAFPQRDLHIRTVQQNVPIQQMHAENGSNSPVNPQQHTKKQHKTE